MKFTPIILLLALSATLFGQGLIISNPPPSVTLAWDPSPGTNYGLVYRVYSGVASHTYTNVTQAGTNLTVMVTNVVRGVTNYFAATAYATNGLESDFSTEVFTLLSAPPKPPTTLRVILSN